MQVNKCKSAIQVIAKITICMILWFIGVILLDFIAQILMAIRGKTKTLDAVDADPLYQTWMTYGGMLLLIAVVWITFAYFDRKKGWDLGLGLLGSKRRLGQGLWSGLLMIIAVCALIWLMSGMHAISWNQTDGITLLNGILLFAGVAVNEELFIRGYVQGLVRYHYGAWTAILLSSLVFAGMHVFNPGFFASVLPALNLIIAGVLFALCREWSGSLWLPIGLHFSWNYVQGYVLGSPVSGQKLQSIFVFENDGLDWISGGMFGAEGSVATTFVLLASVVVVVRLWTKKHQVQKHPTEHGA
ncbi:CPBP family intramembrane glutamic endopeptidase [Paenibacillus sp. KN14-4R]|uniref:CPBP family intramembrane glutamic endopeptidase n=1 Tax=Paenibacillus sp. KN14-4R TaxID=3445773 RepID=UPI003FA01D6B